jgi:hypothetical protein
MQTSLIANGKFKCDVNAPKKITFILGEKNQYKKYNTLDNGNYSKAQDEHFYKLNLKNILFNKNG